MTNCKYKLRKLSVGLVSVGTMLIAPTVLGQEVNASTETSASSTTSTASTAETSTPTGTSGIAGSGTASGTSDVSVASSGGSQSSESRQASTQPQAQTAVAASAPTTASPSSETQTSKSATTTPSATVASPSNGSNQEASAETAPQMMDVEQYKIKDENSSITVTDKDKQLKIRRDIDNPKDKDLFDVKREVKDNGDGTLDVTLKVTPKQIDEGADVMALLDVSKKMTDADFDNAKEKIKKLVKTLTSKSTDSQPNHNARNSVRLMTFYREISDPIDISGKTDEELNKILDDVWQNAKHNWDWGVDLQGAIHKAREIFRKEKESKKRQHIVLFSQGESTFSYDIQKSEKERNNNLSRINEKITSSNPLLHWPPIFNHTHQNADMLNEIERIVKIGEQLGISGLSNIKTILQAAGSGSAILGSIIGGGSFTEYLTLKEYNSDKFKESQFDYTKRVGEGYYYHSFSKRVSHNDAPLKTAIEQAIAQLFPTQGESKNWFEKFLDKFSLVESYRKTQKKALLKILEYLFYKREYHYYNHNLSAIAEAKMAQEEGITFYSVDVTDLNSASKRVRRQTAVRKSTKEEENKKNEEERNTKFDTYLKKMSEDNNFLSNVEERDKFKDTLTGLTIKDEFTDKVTVEKDSWSKSITAGLKNSNNDNVKYQPANTSGWIFNSSKESLTWTVSKDQLKKAFESGKPLTLTYKLKVEKEKFKKALQKQQEQKNRKKRAASPESENTVTETIISNKISYKINNGKDINNNKLEDVKMSYSKFKMPIPELDIEVVVPKVPEKPLVEPMTPLYPAIPNYPTPQLPKDEDLEISGGHGPIVDIVEDTGTGVEGGAQNGVVSTQENKDPIVDITEDTQPGMSGSNDATVVEEDTAPKRPDILVGGQSDPIDITEDTQPSVSGSNDATVVEEDTVPKRPDILVGGQSEPIDITEDTQPGMSGSNDATVIEEDTKLKRFFHFDNEPQAPEKPKEQPSLQDSNSLPQAPAYKAAHHLPASGDKREVYFTIAALTIIGAAGLLSKKRRDTEEN
ncbi:TPA: fibronectin binding protein [Streptococcus pyogenes NGAS401]|nr:fibronectin binding protein [Streptococcus pyogenes]HER4667668.1 fibronectin binding protein [Streptococcus pyogenes NGAS401]HEQ1053369.1 fibronectin binding protein [Streptococcus pyogenes]HEQ1055349.1 fibronectin binding protein [Streptococcus pyogenes]HEQ1092213.1 fibronectin binding protein [Streptococcus pyogenes]